MSMKFEYIKQFAYKKNNSKISVEKWLPFFAASLYYRHQWTETWIQIAQLLCRYRYSRPFRAVHTHTHIVCVCIHLFCIWLIFNRPFQIQSIPLHSGGISHNAGVTKCQTIQMKSINISSSSVSDLKDLQGVSHKFDTNWDLRLI